MCQNCKHCCLQAIGFVKHQEIFIIRQPPPPKERFYTLGTDGTDLNEIGQRDQKAEGSSFNLLFVSSISGDTFKFYLRAVNEAEGNRIHVL